MCRKILVVDDEREIGELVRVTWKRQNKLYWPLTVKRDFGAGKITGRIWLFWILCSPRSTEMEICRRIRMESNIPILMLSAKKSEKIR